MPHSKVKETVAKILADNGFISGVKTLENEGLKTLVVDIIEKDGQARITEIKRLSRPGRRLYVKSPAVPTVKRGRGLIVISTSQGVMTGREATAKNLGGELICEVY